MQRIWNTVSPAARPAKILQSHSPYIGQSFWNKQQTSSSRSKRNLVWIWAELPCHSKAWMPQRRDRKIWRDHIYAKGLEVFLSSWSMLIRWIRFDPAISIIHFKSHPRFASGWMMEPSWRDWHHWSEWSHPHRKTSFHETVQDFQDIFEFTDGSTI